MRNFELQRDNEFASHVCAGTPHIQEREKLNDQNLTTLESSVHTLARLIG
jgi:hypothetical protein